MDADCPFAVLERYTHFVNDDRLGGFGYPQGTAYAEPAPKDASAQLDEAMLATLLRSGAWGGDEPVLEEDVRAWTGQQAPRNDVAWGAAFGQREGAKPTPSWSSDVPSGPTAADSAGRSFCTAIDGMIQSGPSGPRQSKAHGPHVANKTLPQHRAPAQDKASDSEKPAAPTTVMMRNIPCEYTRTMLLQLLDDNGFKGCYDMVYLPINHRNGAAFGYSFVNLTTTDNAERLMECLQGFSGWAMPSDKICEISWSSAIQGLEAHVRRYRDSPMMHDSVPDDFKPALFSSGRRTTFPRPSRSVKAPRSAKPSKRQDTPAGVTTPNSTPPEHAAAEVYSKTASPASSFWNGQPLSSAWT